MNKPVRKKRLIAVSVLFLALSLITWGLTSSVGSFSFKPFETVSASGGVLTGSIGIPKGVDADHPARAVLLCHGANNEYGALKLYATALSSRGYVTVLFNQYNHGQSSVKSDSTNGVADMLRYISTLDFVDQSGIAAIGHTMGGYYLTEALKDSPVPVQSIVNIDYVDMFGSLDNISSYGKADVQFISALVDEHRGSAFVATEYGRLMSFFGTDAAIETGRVYSTEKGRREFSTINVNSCCLAFSPSAIKSASDFISDTFSLPESDVAPVIAMSFMSDLIPFALFVLMILVLIEYLYPEREDYPSVKSRSSRIVYLIPLTFSFSLLSFYMVGKKILMPTMFFPQTDTNGLAISFVFNACIIMAIIFICRRHASGGELAIRSVEREDWGETFRRLSILFVSLFIISRIKVFLTGGPVSFFYTSFSVFTVRKLIAFVIYAAVFLTYFFASSLFLRLFAGGREKHFIYYYYYLAGSLIVMALMYIPYIFMGQLGFLSKRFVLIPISYWLFLCPVLAEIDYRLSDRKYGLISAAVINTLLFSWIFVSSNALYVKL